MSRKMPRQKPHRSVQDYATPRRFLAAVEARFGRIIWDLAAHAGNSVCGDRYYGPGSKYAENSLDRAWECLPVGLLWLNPPFERLAPWADKCSESAEFGARVAMLVPAAVGSNWFAKHVEGQALVLPLRPRLVFVGATDPYPKDLMLVVYDRDQHGDPITGFETWRWDRPLGGEVAA
jgi:phage N-6-adenine-methyltransferase